MKEHFNNGDWVYLVNVDPDFTDAQALQKGEYSEDLRAWKELSEKLVEGERYQIRVYDTDHTLDIHYPSENGVMQISEWFYAERFSKDNFLQRFKQIIDEG